MHFPESPTTESSSRPRETYGKDVVTGFLRLNGATGGAVANRAEVYDAEGDKAEEFDGTHLRKRQQEKQPDS